MTDLYTMPTTSGFVDSVYGTAADTTAIKSLVNQVVDRRFHRQVQKKNAFAKLGLIGPDSYAEGDTSGTAPGYPIIRKTELQATSGDAIKMGQLRNLSSDHLSGGKVLNNQLVQNEKAHDFYNLKVTIERWREADISYGGMNIQRNPYGMSIEQIEDLLLSDWASDKQDTSILYALWTGFAPHIIRAFGTTACAPTANANTLFGNDQTLDTTRTIANLVGNGDDNVKAVTFEIGATYMEQNDFDPVMVNGQPYWVAFISPAASLRLMQDDRFRDAMKDARERGISNPLFRNAEFVYNNVVIYRYDKIRTILGGYNPAGQTVSSYAITEAAYTGIGGGLAYTQLHQTVFLGANACMLAEGTIKKGDRKEDDYGNILGRSVDLIFGARRPDFSQEDAGGTANQSSLVIVNSLVSA